MKHSIIPVLTVVVFLMVATGVSALTHSALRGGKVPTNSSLSVDNTTYINANRILMFVTNHGNFGRDLAGTFGYDYGTFYPYTSVEDIQGNVNSAGDNSPLYAAGLWIGGKVNGEVRLAITEYSSEYVPGPMSGGTFLPDVPEFKVYQLYSDSLESNPNSDYLNWPVGQGAPVDELGDPLMIGDQMLWSVFNDADPVKHTNNNGETSPLGIEIQQTTFAFDRTGSLGHLIYMKYILHNKGVNSIDSCYVSLWADPDLGSASDDLVGCDTLKNQFFCYNSDNSDPQYSTPPAIGFRVLAGPLVASPGDTAVFDQHYVMNYRNLGMTSFTKYVNGYDPDNAIETYNFMQGLNGKTGEPYSYNGTDLKYMHSGDPAGYSGDLDYSPSDRRMMASMGPFTFNPGDSQFVLIEMAVGLGYDRLQSVTFMRQILELGSLMFDPDFIDIDEDGVLDSEDNCLNVYNPDQDDNDYNGSGNACCCGEYTGGFTGNANSSVDGKITLSDITRLIDLVYIFKVPLGCPANGNANGSADGNTTLSDITALIDNVYITKSPTAPCD